jgi:Tol biopolymer transport system component
VKSTIAGSWSPDGRRLALTDSNGYFEMLDRGGISLPLDQGSRGLYPSWNPRGSQIFIGGYVMDSDGKNREELLPNSEKSIAKWSPDGTRIVIISGGDVWLFKDFNPHFIPPDKPRDEALSKKILLLKELMNEGLLTESEYQERYDRLVSGKGN